jgi:hypothetical protein
VGSASDSGQCAQSLEGRAQDERPGPAALQAQSPAPATTGEARRHVEEAVPEPLWLPSSRRSAEAEPLRPGNQVLGDEDEIEPDLVGSEVAEGQVAQTGRLATADPVLDPGMATVPRFQDGEIGFGLVRDEHLKAKPVVVGEGQLRTGMWPLAPTDGPRAGRPRGEVEVVQLASSRLLCPGPLVSPGSASASLKSGQAGSGCTGSRRTATVWGSRSPKAMSTCRSLSARSRARSEGTARKRSLCTAANARIVVSASSTPLGVKRTQELRPSVVQGSRSAKPDSSSRLRTFVTPPEVSRILALMSVGRSLYGAPTPRKARRTA